MDQWVSQALNNIKNTASNLFNQGSQAVQNAVQPIQQDIQNWATQNPQPANQILNAPQQIGNAIGQAGNFIANQPILNNPTPFKSPINPTIGQTVPPMWQQPLRAGENVLQSLPGSNLPQTMQPTGIGKQIFGSQPLQSLQQQVSQGVNLPVVGNVKGAAAIPLVAGGTALSLLPMVGGAEKTALSEGIDLAKSAGTVEDFTKALGEAKPEVQGVISKLIADTKTPVNSVEDFFNQAKGIKAPEAPVANATGNLVQTPEVAPVGKVKLQVKPQTPVEQAVEAQLKPSKFANTTAPQSPNVGKALATSLKDRNVLYTTQTEQAGTDIASEYANGNLTQKSTDVLNTLSKEKGTITRQEALNAQAVALKLQDQLGNVAVENMTPAQKSALETSTNILSQLSEHYTAGGQLSQSAAVLKNQTAQGLYYQAIKTLSGVKDAKGVSLLDKNPELATTISNLTNDVKGTAVGTPEREMAVQRLVKAVTDQVPRSKGDAAFGIWRSMLISGPETAVKVMSSYGINTPGQLLSRPISALTDRIVSDLRGSDRSITFNPSDYGTFGKGMAGGAEAIPTKMKTGLDLPGTSSFNGYDNPAQAMTHSSQQTGFEKVVTRLHASIPKPVYKATYDMNIAEQARTAALNAGKSNDKTFIQNLIDHPTSQMQDVAKVEAEKATNMASNAATKASGGIQQMPYIGKILNPIARVPANIGVQGLVDYSPLGLVKAGGEVVKGIFKGNFDQRAFSTAVGKGAVGTGIAATGFALMQAGRMALAQPNDAKERALNEAQNIPTNSVYVGGTVTKDTNGIFHRSGGTWVSLNVAGAAGLTLAMGGGLAKGGPATALTSGARELADQPYIQGVAGFGQALSDPTRYANTFLDRTATSIVPGFVAQPSAGMDPNQRVYPNNIGDALKAKVPILRQTLPVARNLYGQPLPGANPSGTVIGGVVGSFNPFKPQQSTNQNDPVTTELQRLYNQNGSQGSPAIAQPTANQNIGGQKVKLDSQQLMNYIATRGPQIQQAVGQLIADPNYKALSDDQKTNAINKLLTAIDTQVKGLSGNQILSNNPALNALQASNNMLGMQGYQLSGAPNMNGGVNVQAPANGANPQQGTMTYVDAKGVLQTVNTAIPQKPQLTGNTLLDKKLVSEYNTALTSHDTGVVKLYQAGQLTAQQAGSMMTGSGTVGGTGLTSSGGSSRGNTGSSFANRIRSQTRTNLLRSKRIGMGVKKAPRVKLAKAGKASRIGMVKLAGGSNLKVKAKKKSKIVQV